MTIPFVYQDKEWQTIINIFSTREGLRLRVTILNSRLAQQLSTGNTFVYREGELVPQSHGAVNMSNATLQQAVWNALREYVNTNERDFNKRTIDC